MTANKRKQTYTEMDFKEAIAFVEGFPNPDQPLFGGDSQEAMTPDKMRAFLDSIGGYHSNRGTVHVTGSKGKGSTSSFTASLLNKLDGPAALFVSPHLISYTERITIGGKRISEADFARTMLELKENLSSQTYTKGDSPAQFYLLIALFLKICESWNPTVKWQVLEVGLGGLNDPTNFFTTKDLAIFSPIHIEHKAFLGNSLEDIVHNKAGIIKEGSHVLVSQQDYPEVVSILRERARQIGCQFTYVPEQYQLKDYSVKDDRQMFSLVGPYGTESFATKMLGHHQVINATTAICAIDLLDGKGIKRDTTLINEGLEATFLPGRFEVLDTNPYFIVDGAHTRESAQMLYKFVSENYVYNRLILILAISSDKDCDSIIQAVASPAHKVYATRTGNYRSIESTQLASRIKKITDTSVVSVNELSEAITKALELAEEDDLVLVTGSLYASCEASIAYQRDLSTPAQKKSTKEERKK